MRERRGFQDQPETGTEGAVEPPAPERKRIRVGLGFYLISIVVVVVLVFILMLVQYLPGYRSNHRLSQVIRKSNVELTVRIPMAEIEKREPNPFTRKQKDDVVKLLKDMGAASVTVVILPEDTTGN